jgi:multiple sugar transport system substrate-binding protein
LAHILKNTFRLSGLGLIFMPCMLACLLWSGSVVAGQETETIVLLHYWSGAMSGGIDDMVASFNKEHPRYNLRAFGFEHESFKVGIRAMLDGGNPPDIFSYWAGARVQSLVAGNKIASLDAVWKDARLDEIFTDSMKKACTYNGHKYSLPLTQHFVAFFYNRKIFGSLGISPPATWDEFVNACAKIKAAGIAPLALGARERWPAQFWFDYLLLRTAGPEYRQKLMTGEASYTDPEVVKAFSLWQSLLAKDYFFPVPKAYDWSEAAKQVYHGQAAMTLMGTWIIGLFNGQLGWPEEEGFDFFAFPTLDPSIPDVALGPIDVLVLAEAGNVRGAEHLLPYFAAADLQEKMSAGSGALAPSQKVPPEFYSPLKQRILRVVRAAPTWAFNYDLATPPAVAEVGLNAFLSFVNNPQALQSILQDTQTRVQTVWVKPPAGKL